MQRVDRRFAGDRAEPVLGAQVTDVAPELDDPWERFGHEAECAARVAKRKRARYFVSSSGVGKR
jgi:hypothetical protein